MAEAVQLGLMVVQTGLLCLSASQGETKGTERPW